MVAAIHQEVCLLLKSGQGAIMDGLQCVTLDGALTRIANGNEKEIVTVIETETGRETEIDHGMNEVAVEAARSIWGSRGLI